MNGIKKLNVEDVSRASRALGIVLRDICEKLKQNGRDVFCGYADSEMPGVHPCYVVVERTGRRFLWPQERVLFALYPMLYGGEEVRYELVDTNIKKLVTEEVAKYVSSIGAKRSKCLK